MNFGGIEYPNPNPNPNAIDKTAPNFARLFFRRWILWSGAGDGILGTRSTLARDMPSTHISVATSNICMTFSACLMGLVNWACRRLFFALSIRPWRGMGDTDVSRIDRDVSVFDTLLLS